MFFFFFFSFFSPLFFWVAFQFKDQKVNVEEAMFHLMTSTLFGLHRPSDWTLEPKTKNLEFKWNLIGQKLVSPAIWSWMLKSLLMSKITSHVDLAGWGRSIEQVWVNLPLTLLIFYKTDRLSVVWGKGRFYLKEPLSQSKLKILECYLQNW